MIVGALAWAGHRFLQGGSTRYRPTRAADGRVVGLVDTQLEEPRPRPPVGLDNYRLARKEGAELPKHPKRRWIRSR